MEEKMTFKKFMKMDYVRVSNTLRYFWLGIPEWLVLIYYIAFGLILLPINIIIVPCYIIWYNRIIRRINEKFQ